MELLDYWRTDYSWRRAEEDLNRLPQFKAMIEDVDVHFYHLRAETPDAPALVLTHGWPGSVLEFMGVVERLAYPERFGGVASDAFDVIVPSLPGYAFSAASSRLCGPRRTASLWRQLMIDVLGYDGFFAQGGDWGAAVTCWLGSDHPDVVQGIHVNLFLGPPETEAEDAATREWRRRIAAVQQLESGYAHEQMTRPQTIGLALADTPLGFAAWVIEKFRQWSDCGGALESRFSKDTLLTNIMLYLINDAVASSTMMYYAAANEPARYAERVNVPSGVAIFPREFLPMAPRPAVERVLNVKRWTAMPAGGHFAALEEPVAFADEVRAFFTSLTSERGASI